MNIIPPCCNNSERPARVTARGSIFQSAAKPVNGLTREGIIIES